MEIRGESVTLIRNGNGKSNGNGSRTVHIRINASNPGKLDLVKSLLEANPGQSPVFFWMFDGSSRRKMASSFKVEVTTRFVSEVENLLGKDAVRVV